MHRTAALAVVFLCAPGLIIPSPAVAKGPGPANLSEIKQALGRPLLDASIPLQEIQDFVDARVPRMPRVQLGRGMGRLRASRPAGDA